jgi:hypothetical protein
MRVLRIDEAHFAATPLTSHSQRARAPFRGCVWQQHPRKINMSAQRNRAAIGGAELAPVKSREVDMTTSVKVHHGNSR